MNDIVTTGATIGCVLVVLHAMLYMVLRSSHELRYFVTRWFVFSPCDLDLVYDRRGNVYECIDKARARNITAWAAGIALLYSPVWITLIFLYGVYLVAVKMPYKAIVSGEDAMGKLMNQLARMLGDAINFVKNVFKKARNQ